MQLDQADPKENASEKSNTSPRADSRLDSQPRPGEETRTLCGHHHEFGIEGLVPSKVAEEGATVQEAPVGISAQLNITTVLNPPLGVIVTVKLADCPALTVLRSD